MSMDAAIESDSFTIAAASRVECRRSAWAAADAYGPPDPTARTPSSGAMTSPVPDRSREVFSSATTRKASDWRTEKTLRQLEALLVVADEKTSLLLSGTGDVIAPDEGVLAVGSGGPYASAAAHALLRHSTLDAAAIVKESLSIAASIDIYTNDSIRVETLP